MHNGMFKTLREVVDYYNHPDDFVKGSINRDKALDVPMKLTADEVTDLVTFLEALTDDRFRPAKIASGAPTKNSTLR